MKSVHIDKIVNRNGSSVTVYHLQSSTRNEYGDITETYDSGTSAQAVIDRLTGNDLRYLQEGARIDKDLKGVFKAGVTIDNNDKVTYDSEDYLVRNFATYEAGHGNLFKTCLLRKIHD